MMINFDKEMFAQKLREYRGSLPQVQIAEELEINRASISLLENGKQIPTFETLQKFCLKTQCSIDSFFVKENTSHIFMMMGAVKESDKPKLMDVIERIRIREIYIAIGKRCCD